jgi:transcriptional repressor NrdR
VECMVMDRENVTAKEPTRYILAELKKVNEEWYRNWIFFD